MGITDGSGWAWKWGNQSRWCCAQPRILGAKRLLQHNLFNGGIPGRVWVASGWKVARHSGRMMERHHVTSPGTLVRECEIRKREDNCKKKKKKLAIFCCCYLCMSPLWKHNLRAGFNLGKSRGEIILIDWTTCTFWKWESLLEALSRARMSPSWSAWCIVVTWQV